jgi:hypothetical protein
MKWTPKKFAADVRRKVREFGFSSTYVFADDAPAFCYSTGIFKTYGIPELFVSALPSGLSAELIQAYVKRFSSVTPPISERIPKDQERFDYFLIPVDLELLRPYALASFRYYGDQPFDCLQLIYPDLAMRFPHEAGYDYDQVILGDYRKISSSGPCPS